jgi:hypothetical protein
MRFDYNEPVLFSKACAEQVRPQAFLIVIPHEVRDLQVGRKLQIPHFVRDDKLGVGEAAYATRR